MSTIAELEDARENVIYGAPEGQDARILVEHARAIMPKDRVLVHVAIDDARVEILEELIGFFAPEVSVVKFPAWDCLPYDRVSPNAEISATRVASLCTLLEWDSETKRYPRILLTTVNSVSQKVMPREALRAARFQVKKGERIDQKAFLLFLGGNGYVRTDTVREAGEYAVRGGILDVFPPGFKDPVRLDLFGDEVESIKSFDAMTQLTAGSLHAFSLLPVTEYFLDEQSVARFRSGYREAFGVVDDDDPLYTAVSEGRRYNGMEHWLSLFYEHMETVFDYVPGAAVMCDHHALEALGERRMQVADFYQARLSLAESSSISGAVYHPLPIDALYVDADVLDDPVSFSPFAHPDGLHDAKKGRDFADIRALPDGDVFDALKGYIGSFQQSVLIACYSEGSLSRVKGLMEASDIEGLVVCSDWEAVKKLRDYQVGLVVLPLAHGFVSDGLVIVTEQDVLGDRMARQSKKKRKADNFLTEVSALDEGDLVVHLDHGIGKFIALETIEAATVFHDCLKLEYADGDKLYVPVENMEVLSRFGSDEGTVQLDKLGGAGWQARKARAKKNLMEMADELLKIAAARQLKKAEKLDVDVGIYNEFAARFPYAETEDQERAINDTLVGLANEFPMDRLVCGDVGFGKTEVAIRAAYVAAMDGAQVALAVPTTLLARQHYKNFVNRFEGTGIRIEQLSRMVGAKTVHDTKTGLADGSVNIVIGTHALFAKDVEFSNLGLLIVDEEQRFGVKQKERLKEVKENVHVLTLTATPIPRTLQMSLTGVKEMSLITTPPVDRLAIRTFILPYDAMVIREALLREHYRGGQSFYVCPRIKDMEALEKQLKELVPEIKVITAHGQMASSELDERMTAFYDGQYGILLATNIIESGIDIPTANTMVIHRADMFGLAQLYQIRGRIGRSKQRAYAYLTYQPDKKLTDQAQKRLEVMETLDTLGAGFQLASHDMDIRGAGNLLGDQQSGHIKEVGVELYQQMLEDAVAAARDGYDFTDAPETGWSPQINLGTSVLIPDSYVQDLGVRMALYRRLADLKDEDDLESFAAELIDRFGEFPAEVQNLLDIVSIKQLCRAAGVNEVEAGPKGIVIAFYKDVPPNVDGLMTWIASKGGGIKLRPDQKLFVMRQYEDAEKRVAGARAVMKELASLV